MQLKLSQLKQIIKEEVTRAMNEMVGLTWTPTPRPKPDAVEEKSWLDKNGVVAGAKFKGKLDGKDVTIKISGFSSGMDGRPIIWVGLQGRVEDYYATDLFGVFEKGNFQPMVASKTKSRVSLGT